MITKRQSEILTEVINHPSGITRETLSKNFNVSERTIRNEINEIDDFLIMNQFEPCYYGSNGYYTAGDSDEIRSAIRNQMSNDNYLPQNRKERNIYILLELLDYDDIQISEISDEIFVSRSTVIANLKEIEKFYLSNTSLILKNTSNRLALIGSEYDKRKVFIRLLTECLSNNLYLFFLTLCYQFNYFSEQQLFTFYDYLVQLCNSQNIVISDRSLQMINVAFLWCLDRIKNGFSIEALVSDQSDIEMDYQQISNYFNVPLGQKEINYFDSILSMVKIQQLDNKHIPDDKSKHITDLFIKQICKNYALNEELFMAYSQNIQTHIKSMIQCLTHSVIENDNQSLASMIKTKYPFPYEIATEIIPIVKKEIGIQIPESEICYIAIHIALIFESNKQKINVAIICGSGLATAKIIEMRIKEYFNTRINLVGTYPLYLLDKAIQDNQLDLILTSISIEPIKDIPIIVINELLSDNDIRNIEKYTNQSLYVFSQQKKDAFELKESLFIILQNNLNDEQIIEAMSSLLFKEHMISNQKQFIHSVFYRESLHSTKFGNIWIPHPMSYLTDDSSVVVGLRKDRGQIIFLVTIGKNDTTKFASFYSRISSLVDNAQLASQLLNCNSFNNFNKFFMQL